MCSMSMSRNSGRMSAAKDTAFSSAMARATLARRPTPPSYLGGARQVDREARAAWARVQRDRAVGAFDGALHDCEAESGTRHVALRSAIEAIEHASGVGRRDSRALVGDLDYGLRVVAADA